jgi:hypothetical protein
MYVKYFCVESCLDVAKANGSPGEIVVRKTKEEAEQTRKDIHPCGAPYFTMWRQPVNAGKIAKEAG